MKVKRVLSFDFCSRKGKHRTLESHFVILKIVGQGVALNYKSVDKYLLLTIH